MVVAGLFAGILCAAAPFSVFIGPVPLSFATLVIYLAAGALDMKSSVLSVVLYILLGAIGLPVFSGFGGGFHKIVGVTGGFIIGYFPCAVAICAVLKAFGKKIWVYALGMLAGTFLLYACGTAWYVIQTGSPLAASFALCVAPFLPGDAAKIVAACIIAPRLRKALART
jgi:biotin transport system substrate-specific component